MYRLTIITLLLQLIFLISCTSPCSESSFRYLPIKHINDNEYHFSKDDVHFKLIKTNNGFELEANLLFICEVKMYKNAKLEAVKAYSNDCLNIVTIDTYSKNGIGKIIYNLNTQKSDYILNTKRPLDMFSSDYLTLNEYYNGDYLRYNVHINDTFVRNYNYAVYHFNSQSFDFNDDEESDLEFEHSIRYHKIEELGNIIDHSKIKAVYPDNLKSNNIYTK